MQVKDCTQEFQHIWKRYEQVTVQPEDVRKLIKGRRQIEVYKDEIDHIIDDYAKSFAEPLTPLHQVMKMEELFKQHNELKKNLHKMYHKEDNIYEDLNVNVSRLNIFKYRDIKKPIENRFNTPQQKKSLPSILTNTPKHKVRFETESTNIPTESDVKPKGVFKRLIATTENRKRDVDKFIRDINSYEKVLEKSQDASKRKIEDFEKRKYYFRRRYKNAYEINLALVL
jgi:hypothetical protein